MLYKFYNAIRIYNCILLMKRNNDDEMAIPMHSRTKSIVIKYVNRTPPYLSR